MVLQAPLLIMYRRQTRANHDRPWIAVAQHAAEVGRGGTEQYAAAMQGVCICRQHEGVMARP